MKQANKIKNMKQKPKPKHKRHKTKQSKTKWGVGGQVCPVTMAATPLLELVPLQRD